MSAICGIFNLDGAPVDAGDLERMTAAIRYRGPDGAGLWAAGAVGLAQLQMITTAEAAHERQPLHAADERCILVADARIDNRDELIPLLRAGDYLKKSPGEIITDADIILAAFYRWGESCPAHLVGDFAFAIYTPSERRLFLARDVIGVRQLVYYQDSHRFLFATNLAALLVVLPPQPINRELLMGWVGAEFDRCIDETPYSTIRRLPPSHAITIFPERTRLNRYKMLGEDTGPNYRWESQYIEHFRHLLTQAIQAHLRSDRSAALMASGGLDSSAIACVADREIEIGRSSTQLRAYSMVFPGYPNADEKVYLDLLENACARIPFERVDCSGTWSMKPTPELISFPMDDLDFGIVTWHGELKLMATVAAHDARVLISGLYGDQVLRQDVYHYPELLRSLPIKRWPVELQYFQKTSKRYGWKFLMHAAFGTDQLQALRRRLLTKTENQQNRENISRSSSSAKKRRLSDNSPRRLHPIGQRVFSSIQDGEASVQLRTIDGWYAHFGIETRMPFLDTRLVEFLLHAPPDLLFRNGYSRNILRESLLGILPDQIRLRTTKAHFADLLIRGLADKEKSKIAAMIEDSYLAQHEIIDGTALGNAWADYWKTPTKQLYSMIWSLSAEIWLRSEPSRQSLISDFQRAEPEC